MSGQGRAPGRQHGSGAERAPPRPRAHARHVPAYLRASPARASRPVRVPRHARRLEASPVGRRSQGHGQVAPAASREHQRCRASCVAIPIQRWAFAGEGAGIRLSQKVGSPKRRFLITPVVKRGNQHSPTYAVPIVTFLQQTLPRACPQVDFQAKTEGVAGVAWPTRPEGTMMAVTAAPTPAPG